VRAAIGRDSETKTESIKARSSQGSGRELGHSDFVFQPAMWRSFRYVTQSGMRLLEPFEGKLPEQVFIVRSIFREPERQQSYY